MTLAFLITICVGASLAAAVFAARTRRAPAAPLVLLSVLLPLAAFAYLQSQARPTRSALAFEVIGQFHSLGDAITFSDDANADVALGDRVAASVSLEYNAPTRQYEVQVR